MLGMSKIKVDFARGFAYVGKRGFIIMLSPEGLYIDRNGKIIYLTEENTKVLENSY